MRVRLLAALLLVPLSGAFRSLEAQRFEGVLNERTIEVSLDALADRGFEMSEALFDVPLDELLALRSQLEGRGDMSVTQAEIVIKGDRMRMDASAEDGPAYATIDLESGVTRLVRPEEGVYIEMTRGDFEQMQGLWEDFEIEPAEITKTRHSKTINGMRATAYDVASGDELSRIWVSADDSELMVSFQRLVEGMEMVSMGEAPDPSMTLAEHGVPILVQTLDYDMYRVEEIVSVDRRSVPDDLFEPPAGMERMSMQDVMGGADLSDLPTAAGGASAERAGQALAGLMGGREAAAVWIEYDVTGAVEASGREDDVVMCSETDDGFQSRSLGEVIIGLEADGGGQGRHEATVTVDGFSGRFTGRGTLTISSVGQDGFGFEIYEVEFEGTDLESNGGGVVHVQGQLSCSAM